MDTTRASLTFPSCCKSGGAPQQAMPGQPREASHPGFLLRPVPFGNTTTYPPMAIVICCKDAFVYTGWRSTSYHVSIVQIFDSVRCKDISNSCLANPPQFSHFTSLSSRRLGDRSLELNDGINSCWSITFSVVFPLLTESIFSFILKTIICRKKHCIQFIYHWIAGMRGEKAY